VEGAASNDRPYSDCAARHERSNDWPQGGAQRSP